MVSSEPEPRLEKHHGSATDMSTPPESTVPEQVDPVKLPIQAETAVKRAEAAVSQFSRSNSESNLAISNASLRLPGVSLMQQIFSLWRAARSRRPSQASSTQNGRNQLSFKGNNKALLMMAKFAKFIGPGFMIAVAYIDPGNYSTDVAAGAQSGYKLLFIVLMSNLFAVVLQSLAVRLGTVTGMNLAESCRAYLPRWLNYVLYVLAEAAIIATDIAEVIGSAIAFNLLLKIPLVAGCALTMADVLFILIFYRPDGGMRGVRLFEYFVTAMVFTVVICFCIQLSLLEDTAVGEVFKGYLPSSAVVEGQGIFLSCGILGATVMPHSLYLGSGLCQPRLKEFDDKHPEFQLQSNDTALDADQDSIIEDNTKPTYRPSMQAIKYCLKYSTIELIMSLSIFALFVNSAILIVSGASLYDNEQAQDADLFSIHDLLARTIAPAAGTVFAVALLFSGTSAGIVCTIAGQMVSEGQIRWKIKPWLRRLLTRTLSITPSIIIAASIGQKGLSAALNASQVTLSVILPFVTAPLIYFTCRSKFMTVGGLGANDGSNGSGSVNMRNHFLLCILAVLIWLVITVMNTALVVLAALGKV